MSDFLLIHGSCHGAGCWRDTIPALQAQGHTARAIDLPGHGDDPAPPGEVTLDRYRDALLPAMIRAADGKTFTIDPAQARGVFYHDCSDAQVAYAVPRLCAQAMLPQETPLILSDAYAGVPAAYIRCTDDRTIPPEYQATMSAGLPRDRVPEMAASHSPFFADPDGLARLPGQIGEGF